MKIGAHVCKAFLRQCVFLAAFSLAVTEAHAAGLMELQIPADASGPGFEAMIWTPCATPPKNIAIEPPLVVPGIRNCPIVGSKLPLIIISHGGGSAPIFHHDTAEALADAGFMVAALHHPNDPAGGLDRAWLLERPTDVRRLLDYILGPSPVAAKIDPRRIGFFGFSRGGYTGLVLAGAVPEYPTILRVWLQLSIWVFHHDMPLPLPKPDPRIKAFVLADPLTLFFTDKQSVGQVKAPIQLWSSQNGGAGVTPQDVAIVARNLPARPEFHFVPQSQHFSFAMPCTSAMAKVAADLCADPPGFDRAAFHKQFNSQVLAFFRKSLAG
jgi:predicted dienelactone hydrolase